MSVNIYDRETKDLTPVAGRVAGNYVPISDVLSAEEIAASSDLVGKVPSAEAYNALNGNLNNYIIASTTIINIRSISLNSFYGTPLNSIVADYLIDVPSGYKLLANVDVRLNGIGGIMTVFDGTSAMTNTKPSIYLFNATSATKSGSAYVTITSLFVKK